MTEILIYLLRGGCWFHDGGDARCAQRFPLDPTLCGRRYGFRLAARRK